MEDSIKAPSFLESDFAKFGRSSHLHTAMQALHKFQEQSGSLPKPWNADDAETLVAIAKSLDVHSLITAPNSVQQVEVDDDLVTKLAYTASGSIIPITAGIGGFVSQEVLKSITGKFTPLNQWACAFWASLTKLVLFRCPRSHRKRIC